MSVVEEERQRRFEERVQKRLDKCVHFSGTFREVCRAGLVYRNLKAPREGGGYRLPCFCGEGGDIACPKREFLQREEVVRDLEEGDRETREYFAKIGEGVCPECGSDKWSQVGRCVYCNGCGHRLYQGTLPKGKR